MEALVPVPGGLLAGPLPDPLLLSDHENVHMPHVLPSW